MVLRLLRGCVLVFRKAILLTDGDKLLTEGDDKLLTLAPFSTEFLLTFCLPAHHTRGAIV